jgi:DNA invertase Pin-like site-specific DNA recombinase
VGKVYAYDRLNTYDGMSHILCDSFADENKYIIAKKYRDNRSGTSELLEKRFNEILKDMCADGINILLVPSFDRVSREDALFYKIVSSFHSRGCQIVQVFPAMSSIDLPASASLPQK